MAARKVRVAGCDCIAQIDKLLAEKHHMVKHALTLKGIRPRALVEIVKRAGAPRNAPRLVLAATFCPFCGKPYE